MGNVRWVNVAGFVAAEWPMAAINRAKTHCSRGHPFAGENLIRRPDGRRGCRICRRAWSKEWLARNPERARQYRQNRREVDRDAINRRARERHQENPEISRATHRRYRERNREAIGERTRAYRALHRDELNGRKRAARARKKAERAAADARPGG